MSRTRLTLVSGLLVVVVAAVAAVVVSSGEPEAQYHDPYTPPPQAETRCGDFPAREVCFALGADIRYALLKASDPTAETVILDLGRPGLPVLSGRASLQNVVESHPPLNERFNVLVLEEPWVTTGGPPHPPGEAAPCDPAVEGFYRGLRDSSENLMRRGRELADGCELEDHDWGFGIREYPQLVERILERHALTLEGFVGHSWGSVRLRYLHELSLRGMSLDFAALVRPFPVGVSAKRLVDARAEAIDSTAPGALRAVESTERELRSVPVTYFDQLSAVAALGYSDGREFEARADDVFSGDDPELIGRLSDDYWQRYDVHAMSHGMLARWQEVCQTVEGAVPSFREPPTSVRDVLAAEFAPCAQMSAVSLPQMAAGDWSTTSREPPPRPANCIVTAPHDTVVPQHLVHTAHSFLPREDVTWVESDVRAHRSLDGLTECLSRIVDP